MKKILFIFNLLMFAAAFSAQAFNVTFKVDMNNVTAGFTTPEVNGTFNGWCGGCAPMSDANGDGIWELTINLAAGTYEYKFAADTWNIQESLNPGSSCTLTTGNFTNRLLVVTADAVLEPVCWGSCTACGVGAQFYNVTFQVDMNNVTDPYTTPEVNGTFNGWCGGCAAMTDNNADGIWDITINLQEGNYEYKFAADSWNIQEALTQGSPCTVTNSGFTNRSLTVSQDITLDPVCWGSCSPCGVQAQLYNVTFQVDMNNVTDPYTNPEINGTFNAWCGNCAALTDVNGDGIWEITIGLEAGTYEYKFSADNWNIQEMMTEGDPCTVNAAPFVNRALTVSSDVVLDPVCWGSCSSCNGGTGGNNDGIINLTFDEEASITAWTAVADATLPESYINWLPSGVTTGTMEIGGNNTSDAIGRAYIYQYLDGNVNYGGATSVTLSFDLKLSDPLAGAAIHLQSEFPGIGVTNTFDLQNAGLNSNDWTHYTYTFNGVTAGSIFRIQFNIAAGAFIGSGGGLLVDNVMVMGNGTNGGGSTPGCTDETANNYNPDANLEDGSCMYFVTFQVDMQNVTDAFTNPEVNGTFNGWCGNCTPMTDDNADGIWDVTVELQAGNYEFKYSADNWNIQETLSEGDICTVNAAPFVNRIINVPFDTTLEPVCWGACVACDQVEETFNVTFQVDMQNVAEPFTTPEVNGTFNGWCGGCAPMSDDDGDGIWTLTIALAAGEYEFKYAADTWSIQEELTPGSACTVTNNGFTNRYLSVTEDATLDVVCWASCSSCDVVVPTYFVTFQIDMQNVTDAFTTPEVNGTFNGWCGNCAQMTDDNADGVWNITIPLQEGNYEFKYSADNWNIQEELTPGSSCTVTANGFTNRSISVTEDMTMDIVCWASCDACIVGVNELIYADLNIYPNPANTEIRIDGLNFNGSIPTLKIYDSIGRLVQQSTITNVQSVAIDVTSLVNGIYMVELGVDGVQFTQKLMIQH